MSKIHSRIGLKPFTWNANRKELPSGFRRRRFLTEFHIKWVNYMGDQDSWSPIDMRLEEYSNKRFVHKAPFSLELPTSIFDPVIIDANNRFTVAQGKRKITDPSFQCLVRPLGVRNVNHTIEQMPEGSEALVFKDAYGQGADYILNPHHGIVPSFKKIVRFDKPPTKDVRLDFEICLDGVVGDIRKRIHSKWDGSPAQIKGRIIARREETSLRRLDLVEAMIWDSGKGENQKRKRIKTILQHKNGKLILTKILPVEIFRDMVFPVFTDTDFYPEPGTTEDGAVQAYNIGWSKSWAELRAESGTQAYNSGTEGGPIYVWADSVTDKWYGLRESIYSYDTSSIDDSHEVTEAIHSLYIVGKGNGLSWPEAERTIHVVEASPGDVSSLATTDYQSALETTDLGSLDHDDLSNNAYNDWTLNAAGRAIISKTGVTSIGNRFGADLSNDDPTWSNSTIYITARWADYSGTTYDPKMAITSEEPTEEYDAYRHLEARLDAVYVVKSYLRSLMNFAGTHKEFLSGLLDAVFVQKKYLEGRMLLETSLQKYLNGDLDLTYTKRRFLDGAIDPVYAGKKFLYGTFCPVRTWPHPNNQGIFIRLTNVVREM